MDRFDKRWRSPYHVGRRIPFQPPMPRPLGAMLRPAPAHTEPAQVAPQGNELRDARAPAQGAQADELAALRRENERLAALLAAAEDDQERRASERRAAVDHVDEIERVKERLRKEAAREIARHERDLVRDFIEVLDDLDRAVQAAQGPGEAPSVREGVELVRKSFRGKLARLGVQREAALGAAFDPARHEAVGVLPVVDPAKDGMIVDVVREGYLMGGDVLRPARVVVARAS